MTFHPNAFRAAAANLADAGDCGREIERLIQWHENQTMVHTNAIATLRKALSHTKIVIEACHEEAQAAKAQT